MNKMWRCRKDGKSGAVCVRLASIHGDSPDDEIRYVMAEDSGTAQEIATERFWADKESVGSVYVEAVAAKAQALVNAEEIEKLHAQLTQVSLSLGATQGHLNLVDSLLHGRTDRLSPEVRVVVNTMQPLASPTDNKRMWKCCLILDKKKIIITSVHPGETFLPSDSEFFTTQSNHSDAMEYAAHVMLSVFGVEADYDQTEIVYTRESRTQVPQEGPDMPGGPHLWRCWYANVDTKEITCKCLGKQKASFAAFGECIVLAYRGSEAEELAKERLASR